MQRDLAWMRHYDWIHRKVDTDPVFSPDGTVTAPLKELYLRLRCFWHQELDIDEDDTRSPRWIAHLDDLHNTAETWLSAPTQGNDHLLLITGGPGSGKSSFARVFASETVLRASHRVLFIELQHMGRMTGELEGDIAKYFTKRYKKGTPDGTAGFPDNPLEWLKSDDRPVLFVFDGLDELSFDDARAEEINRKLILHVKHMLSQLNSDGTAAKALILGRNQSVQTGMKDAGIDLDKMLNVAPIKEISTEDLNVTERRDRSFSRDRCEFPDFETLPKKLTEDQRPTYWGNWIRCNGKKEAMPEAVRHPSLRDLNVEPLLLHLLILSDFCGERWQEAADNRNCVYEDILTKVHQRNANKETPTTWTRKQFFGLMKALGLAAWRGNQRAGTETVFNAVRDVHAKHLFKGDNAPGSTDLKNVVLQTHARRIDGEEAGFEFIHKSFGEYLAARGLISASERWHKKFMDDDGPEEAVLALEWTKLIADAELTQEVVKFLYDEARFRAQEAQKIETKETLEKILQWASENGMPVHNKNDGAYSFRALEAHQRCGEGALLACASAWASASPDPKVLVNPKWPYGEEIRCLERLRVTHFGANRIVLSGIDLKGADLGGANLSMAVLIMADLSGASLTRGSLIAANLIRADLTMASLIEANLSAADLSGADLSGADLSGAELKSTDLARCRLAATRARSVDFRSTVGFEPHAVKSVFGVRSGYGKTLLPEGMAYPDHWHDAAEATEDSEELRQAFNRDFEEWRSTLSDE